MNTSLIIILIIWLFCAVIASWRIYKAAEYSTFQRVMLFIMAWAVPIFGALLDLLALHSSGKLPWKNTNIEGSPEAMIPPYDVGDFHSTDDQT
jgi:hypothetical protein